MKEILITIDEETENISIESNMGEEEVFGAIMVVAMQLSEQGDD